MIGSNYGDSNLDGVFDSGDLIDVFKEGQYEDTIALNSTWETGDWNGDGEFGTADLIVAFQAGGYSDSSVAATAPVPEPSLHWILLPALWLTIRPFRHQKK